MANANPASTTGICLHALPAREEAVLKRVIAFSGSQGRNYVLSAMDKADMLVVSDETEVDFADMNPEGCMIIRIADPGTARAYDVLMQRPLLVTKVMRTLDEANAMLQPPQQEPEATESIETVEATPVQVVEPQNDTASDSVHPETDDAKTSAEATSEEADVSSPAEEQAADVSELVPEAPVSESETKPQNPVQEKPKPVLSLYAQIMGTGVKATADTTEAKSAAETSDPGPAADKQEEAVNNITVADDVAMAEAEQGSLSTEKLDETDGEAAEAQADKEASVEEAAEVSGIVDSELADPAKPTGTQQAEFHHFALVVDDSAAIRKQLELELRAAGIGADFAETGEEALEKVAAQSYDLIFLDIIMPGIDGYETCRQMRIRSEMKKTPIIMLSAKTSPLDEVQGVIAGASTYLTKPVKSEQLQKTLKRVSMWLDNFQVSA
ncbi:MAG: response regulator [Thiolinea sp.]